jgi:hypothetical protein
MEALADQGVRLVEAADSGWAVLAIVAIGSFVIAWKYGGQVVALLQANLERTEHVATSIITNHGSKNIGDAIDRLTESTTLHTGQLAQLTMQLDHHITEYNARNKENAPLLDLSRQLLIERLQAQLKGNEDGPH